MGESLYSLLGVGRDADPETIRQAYRDRARDEHPDVSDDPHATRQFKRLIVARDTLLDEDERDRYDRMGHEAYLRQHARAELFGLTAERADRAAEPRGTGETERTDAVNEGTATPGTDDEWWRDRDGPQGRSTGGATAHVTDAGPAAAWARAGEPTTPRHGPAARERVLRFVREAGGWLLFHALLLGSAGATGWVIYRSLPPQFAIAGLFAMFGILGIAVTATVLHLVSIVYT
ncbi:DnaJ domain-containing protein [Halapricum hydrolyticum]|uniref:DnaJ domain-containing protein n=1 Tax=Halapricum hydrolyticum TaxID=2979991 RepID=A0AAE3IAV0_9EURY|nr:DnaJ domain-containing protein [Halapricum hydrolyticum]MCU4717958.1 DnaJ domain-containing protein [Halapricum hydrolyticum]MCU4727123.1 DnaJ domain-containing protein [Halapricum hydrolyticum]